MATFSKMFSVYGGGLISELDVYYAVFTLVFLGYVLFWSFAKRRLMMLAYLSIACILVTFAAQLYKLSGSNVNLTLFSAIFKTSLIMIFFALALSWVKELVENVLPPSEKLYLRLQVNRASHRVQYQINLHGIPGQTNSDLILTPALYDLLLKFAQRKIGGDHWLEIKPKKDLRSSKEYDINDHNQIKRLVHSMLDGLFGKGCWSKEQHEIPLREALFELSDKRERRMRLRLPAENISILNT
ncbi:MAG: hypothetical protein DHS20C17_28950 [Cyclobacteriaceae bacterium]|nr:MAG: hypothetical protein DHS20C17_28950 [Cyclobacteriaceae bacterium]